MTTDLKQKITTAAAARIIGCTEPHVSYLIRHGEVSAEKFGQVWAVDRKSAEKYGATPKRLGRPRSRQRA